MKIQSIMSPSSMITIDSSWTLGEVSKFFNSMQTDYLAITRDGVHLGILPRERFYHFIRNQGNDLSSLSHKSVTSVMDKNSHYCKPSIHIRDALRMMRDNKVLYLAVKSYDTVIGVINLSTVATAIANAFSEGMNMKIVNTP